MYSAGKEKPIVLADARNRQPVNFLFRGETAGKKTEQGKLYSEISLQKNHCSLNMNR